MENESGRISHFKYDDNWIKNHEPSIIFMNCSKDEILVVTLGPEKEDNRQSKLSSNEMVILKFRDTIENIFIIVSPPQKLASEIIPINSFVSYMA